jgi:hypothetical protein
VKEYEAILPKFSQSSTRKLVSSVIGASLKRHAKESSAEHISTMRAVCYVTY